MSPRPSLKGSSSEWTEKESTIMRKVLPETWTHIHNVNVLQIGFALKLCGIDWRSDADLASAMGLLERLGLVQRQGYTIRRVP